MEETAPGHLKHGALVSKKDCELPERTVKLISSYQIEIKRAKVFFLILGF